MNKKVCDTMNVIFNEEKKIDYIVIKIGNKTFSTSFEEIKKGLIRGNLQIVNTKGIGEQAQLWIKGKFTEGKNHEKLEEEIDFELNLYFHNEKEGENGKQM